MPRFGKAWLMQKAVVWDHSLTANDAYGQPTVGGPREINVRWNSTHILSADAQGNPVTISAQVVVMSDVAVGSLMWLGTLDEWYGTGSATDEAELMEVKKDAGTPDLKNRSGTTTLDLAYYRGELPGG